MNDFRICNKAFLDTQIYSMSSGGVYNLLYINYIWNIRNIIYTSYFVYE